MMICLIGMILMNWTKNQCSQCSTLAQEVKRLHCENKLLKLEIKRLRRILAKVELFCLDTLAKVQGRLQAGKLPRGNWAYLKGVETTLIAVLAKLGD